MLDFKENTCSDPEQYYRQINELVSHCVVLHYAEYLDDRDILDSPLYRQLQGLSDPSAPIVVISKDTQEEITLSGEILLSHPKTALWLLNQEVRTALIEKYPNQALFIRSIFYAMKGVDIHSYQDGELIHYPKGRIAPNEITLIQDINARLIAFRSKYDLNAYQVSDSWFNSAYGNMLYFLLPGIVAQERLKRVGTHESHPFHTHHYLVSRSIPPDAVKGLSHRQQMYLLKNIDDVHRRIGREDTLSDLIEGLLTGSPYGATSYRLSRRNTGDEVVPVAVPIDRYHGDTRIWNIDAYQRRDAPVSGTDYALALKDKEASSNSQRTKTIAIHRHTPDAHIPISYRAYVYNLMVYCVYRQLYTGLVTLPAKTRTSVTLIQALEILRALQRKVFGIGDMTIPCQVSLGIVYHPEQVDDIYAVTRTTLLSLGDDLSLLLDILPRLKPTSTMNSVHEFTRYAQETYEHYLAIQDRIYAISDIQIRSVYLRYLSSYYSPVDSIYVPDRGGDIRVLTDIPQDPKEIDALYQYLQTALMGDSIDPQGEAIVDVLSVLTGYHNRYRLTPPNHLVISGGNSFMEGETP
jgi:hypothetical protein